MRGYLELSDDELLAQCSVDTFRASGPGGQKRNKTESAVRLRHHPTGLVAQAFESRSQHQNRELALRRLRAAIAAGVRRPVDLAGYEPPEELRRILPLGQRDRVGGRNPAFWPGVQALLDLMAALEYSISDTAAVLGISTGQLSRLITGEPEILRVVNARREANGLRALRPG
ncbi:MAG: peptide chain release factor-like protein [Hyphomicrobiales bacterium]